MVIRTNCHLVLEFRFALSRLDWRLVQRPVHVLELDILVWLAGHNLPIVLHGLYCYLRIRFLLWYSLAIQYNLLHPVENHWLRSFSISSVPNPEATQRRYESELGPLRQIIPQGLHNSHESISNWILWFYESKKMESHYVVLWAVRRSSNAVSVLRCQLVPSWPHGWNLGARFLQREIFLIRLESWCFPMIIIIFKV